MNHGTVQGQAADRALIAREVGETIRAVRRQRHLSQVELARRVGIRAGPMNNLEKGRNLPSAGVLFRIASHLGVTVDSLLRPEGTLYVQAPTVAVQCVRETADRNYGSYLAESTREAEERPVLGEEEFKILNRVAEAYLALEDLCGAPKRSTIPMYVPFEPDGAGLAGLVAHVRRLMGIGSAVVFDYLELFENVGLRVTFLRLPGETLSLSCYDEPNGNAFLFIRRRMNAEKQVFRLLYELGRIYLHTRRRYGGEGRTAEGRRPTGGLDDEHAARKFAALFLMPEEAVRTTVVQTGVRPEGWSYELLLRLKHRFGVSAESFAIRLEELGLIESPHAERFKRRIRSHYRGQRFVEPDSSRRILSPNGRLGDLLLSALADTRSRAEACEIARKLREAGVDGIEPVTVGDGGKP